MKIDKNKNFIALSSLGKTDSFLPSNLSTMHYRCQNDSSWSMKFISESCNQILGCSSLELIKNEVSYGSLIDPNDSDMVWEVIQESIFHNIPYQLVYSAITVSGTEKIFFEQGQGILLEGKQEIELQGFITDITQLIKPAQLDSVQSSFQVLYTELIDIVEKNNNCKIHKQNISTREMQVCVHFCQGMSMKEIGAKLQISFRTVEMHLNRLKQKLYCHTSSDLRKIFFMTNIGRKLISLA